MLCCVCALISVNLPRHRTGVLSCPDDTPSPCCYVHIPNPAFRTAWPTDCSDHLSVRPSIYPSYPRLSSPIHPSRSIPGNLSLAGGAARPLLEDGLLALVQDGVLALVHAVEPVAEAGSRAREHGVRPQRAAVEEGPHLQAQLPEPDRYACSVCVPVPRAGG